MEIKIKENYGQINAIEYNKSAELIAQVIAQLTDKQYEDLQKDLDAAKAAKAEDRRKIVLAILQGLASVASIGASAAKMLGG